jgi:hypothetical protein
VLEFLAVDYLNGRAFEITLWVASAAVALVAIAFLAALVWLFLYTLRDGRQQVADHRRRYALCVQCGYSLTGNTSGVCPECGTPVAKAGLEQ